MRGGLAGWVANPAYRREAWWVGTKEKKPCAQIQRERESRAGDDDDMPPHHRKRTRIGAPSSPQSQVSQLSSSSGSLSHKAKTLPEICSEPDLKALLSNNCRYIDYLDQSYHTTIQTAIRVGESDNPVFGLYGDSTLHAAFAYAMRKLEQWNPQLKAVVHEPESESPPPPSPPPPKITTDQSVGTDPIELQPLAYLPPKTSITTEANVSPKPPSQSPSKPKRKSNPVNAPLQAPRPTKKQVRLVVHLAGKRDTQYFRDFPTEFFQLLVQNLKRSTPGVIPLGFHINRRGNMIITFPDHIPRPTLMANLDIIRNTLNVNDEVRITFDTPRSTIHLANVPARPGPNIPVFSETELAESLLNNPAILSLDITSKPRWLRKPENITGARSSVVLSFEDPDGAIACSLLKIPIYIFGAPVTVKPWLAKPANSTRACSREPRPPTLDVKMD